MTNEEFDRAYKSLNKEQKKAVDSFEDPTMVVAGPGTGKTKILTLRIAKMLEGSVLPENILALTYTTAGVISMREKLLEIIGDRAYRVNIFTFHAFCEHIMKEFSFYFKKLEGFRVIGDLERVEIIESIINKNNFKHLVSFHDEFSFLNKIVSGILAIKKEGLTPDDFISKLSIWEKDLLSNDDIYYKKDYGEYKKGDLKPSEKEKIDKKILKAQELGEIFKCYQEEIEKLGLYDFSDMIISVKEELEKNKDLKSDVQEKYQYILVDEHQDTNEGQNMILEFLTDAPHLEGKPNIFTVGDEKQSIYRFQGASAKTFSHFQELYKDVGVITLFENYRSTGSILGGSHSLIVKSDGMENSINLHSNKNEDEKIHIREFSNYKFELLYVAEEIKKMIDSGVPPSEIAVLYRANKNVIDIKSALDSYKIPYTIFSKDKILEDKNIINIINILRVIYNPNDNHHLGKVLFINFLNFDSYDVVNILDKYRSDRGENKKNVFSIINDENIMKDIGVKNTKSFILFTKIIKELKTESMNKSFSDFFKIFLEKIGYLKYMIASPDGRNQLVKLDKLLDEIKRQIVSRKNYGLSEFIYFVDSFGKYNLDINSTDPEIVEGVSLMTAHGSKGREFEHVYIINVTRKSWEASTGGGGGISLPIYQYDGDKEDERRLFYVAMTRAKNSLSISFSRLDNDGREHEVSEFVNEIDSKYKEEEKMSEFEEKNIDKLTLFMKFENQSKSLFDPIYIKQLFFKRGLNVTALNNYIECPKKYLYKNLIRIPDTYSSSMDFGSLIHKSLEYFFKECRREEKILDKKVLLEEFNSRLKRLNIDEKEDEKFKSKGILILSDYYDQYHKDWNFKVKVEFGIKRKFELNTKENIELTGNIDKIEYIDDNKINLIDYKTGKPFSEKKKEDKLNYERQIIFYHLLLDEQKDDRLFINKSILDFLEKNKKGNFEQYSFDVKKEHLDRLKEEINDCASGIISMEFLQNGCNKKDCEWCNL